MSPLRKTSEIVACVFYGRQDEKTAENQRFSAEQKRENKAPPENQINFLGKNPTFDVRSAERRKNLSLIRLIQKRFDRYHEPTPDALSYLSR